MRNEYDQNALYTFIKTYVYVGGVFCPDHPAAASKITDLETI